MDLPNGLTVSVYDLLPFSPSVGPRQRVASRFPQGGVLDAGIIHFAENMGGDVFCFDCRSDPDRSSVALSSVDFGLAPLSPDVTGVLGLPHA